MKFKVGDKVKVANPKYSFKEHYKNQIFTIKAINPNGTAGYDETHYGVVERCGYIWMESELMSMIESKIVITTDGKITTAKLYENGKVVKTAEAKCCPEDTFDFNVGANLAINRLIGKPIGEKKLVEVDGFKVGDRVNYDGRNGTIIAISAINNLGVEFDEPVPFGHNCSGVELKAGKSGKINCCRWLGSSKLTHGETPKYYNGKVVCVTNYYEDKTPISDFTIGKVYTVTNGAIVNDDGFVSMQYRDIESLCGGMGNTFIPLVED